MTNQEQLGAEVTARLGSADDVPNRRTLVRILAKLPTPGFYLAVTEAGQELTLHRNQIETGNALHHELQT